MCNQDLEGTIKTNKILARTQGIMENGKKSNYYMTQFMQHFLNEKKCKYGEQISS